MNLINKILVPMDFSDSSMNAFQYALNLVDSDNSIQLILLHVIDQDDNPVEMMEAMNQFDTLKSHVPQFVNHLEIIVKHGSMIETIVETANEIKPKLVLMGTKGKSNSLLHAESNTSMLVQKLDRSVLVVPQSCENYDIHDIAVAIDKELDNPTDLALVHDLARWFDAKVHVLTINNNQVEAATMSGQVESTLEYYLDTLDYTYELANDTDIVHGIQQYIDEHQVNMLAILPKTHAKSSEPSGGKLTRVLTLQSKVPLLIVD